MGRGEETGLGRVAAAITDEIAVDWTAERRDHPELASELDGLRLLERIGSVFRAPATAPAGEAWGPLGIRDQLGEGAYGTVYRAYDPRLQREVALKLLRDDLPGGGVHARRILAEARLMARVRHPNVLVIHGADEHDGRVGFWTDLLEGVTLEQRLADGEILGAGEAALYGRDLCRALGAVHAAGLVHGDVKAANVMRDRQGHIVLMDFGAGVESAAALAGDGPLSGTPLVLAPELLTGGAPGPATDLYSLGVLLYRLVTGRYPVEADTIAELKRRHADGIRTPLLDRRPDLPAGFVQAVETTLDADPARRFASAGQMERALAADLVTPAAGRHGRRRVLGIIAATAAVIAVAVAWPALRTQFGGASAALSGTATFLRTGSDMDEPLADAALVRPGDTLGLNLQLSAPAHVYVLNEDQSGAVFALFPLAESDLMNPLPTDQLLRLPGSRGSAVLAWEVTSGRGEERFLVIASRQPVAWLEEQLSGYAAPVPNPERSYRQLDPSVVNPERGVGSLAESAPPNTSESVLEGLAGRLTAGSDDPSDLWMHHLMLYNLGR